MNNTFNMQRFLWLFNKHTKENYKTYLMSIGVFVAILSFTMGYVAYFGGLNNGTQEAFFAFFLTFPGTVFASLAFSKLGSKSGAISILTLPVSTFERYLVGWIYSFVIFQIVFFTCFFAVDIAIVNISNHYLKTETKLIDITSEETKLYVVFFYFWFLQSVAFLGSIFFNKLHFIKTALVFFLALIILVVTNKIMAQLIMDSQVSARFPFSNLFIKDGISSYYIAAQPSVILTVVLCISALCLWVAAYFKLKEKQV